MKGIPGKLEINDQLAKSCIRAAADNGLRSGKLIFGAIMVGQAQTIVTETAGYGDYSRQLNRLSQTDEDKKIGVAYLEQAWNDGEKYAYNTLSEYYLSAGNINLSEHYAREGAKKGNALCIDMLDHGYSTSRGGGGYFGKNEILARCYEKLRSGAVEHDLDSECPRPTPFRLEQ